MSPIPDSGFLQPMERAIAGDSISDGAYLGIIRPDWGHLHGLEPTSNRGGSALKRSAAWGSLIPWRRSAMTAMSSRTPVRAGRFGTEQTARMKETRVVGGLVTSTRKPTSRQTDTSETSHEANKAR
jgi:hypothetical protein